MSTGAPREPASSLRAASEALRAFVNEMPWERGPIAQFVEGASREMRAGDAVLDVGAGNAPYRELFAHVRYVTNDWAGTPHRAATASDVLAPADDLPLAEGCFDHVLCTQVLEHVPDPGRVLGELWRILRPGGRLFVTVPLAWELHEEPHDYFRFTEHGVRHLLMEAGFVDVEARTRGNSFSALAQLVVNVSKAMGTADDGLDGQREIATDRLQELATELARLAPLDARSALPLGYQVTATKGPR